MPALTPCFPKACIIYQPVLFSLGHHFKSLLVIFLAIGVVLVTGTPCPNTTWNGVFFVIQEACGLVPNWACCYRPLSVPAAWNLPLGRRCQGKIRRAGNALWVIPVKGQRSTRAGVIREGLQAMMHVWHVAERRQEAGLGTQSLSPRGMERREHLGWLLEGAALGRDSQAPRKPHRSGRSLLGERGGVQGRKGALGAR